MLQAAARDHEAKKRLAITGSKRSLSQSTQANPTPPSSVPALNLRAFGASFPSSAVAVGIDDASARLSFMARSGLHTARSSVESTSRSSRAGSITRTRSSARMKFVSSDHDDAAYVRMDVGGGSGTRDVSLSLDMSTLTSRVKDLCTADAETLRQERIDRARRLQKAAEEAAVREARLAAELVEDRKDAAVRFNDFRIRMVLAWTLSNLLLVAAVLSLDPTLARFTTAMAATVAGVTAFKLLGAVTYQLTRCCRHLLRTHCPWCYRIETDPAGHERRVCRCRGRNYYALE